jgi:hypothetical protein
MPSDRVVPTAPEAELPELSGAVRALRPDERNRSFARQWGPKIDKLRQIAVKLGLRPHRVFLVHMQWSGQKVGEGTEAVISRREILPTPRILDMTGTNEILSAVGRTEEGNLTIDRISTRFTEDDLMGATPDLIDPAIPRSGKRNAEFFWEVLWDFRGTTPGAIPRRYIPSAAPTFEAGACQWRVSLAKQNYNRPRAQAAL